MWTSCSVKIQTVRRSQASTLHHCKLQIGCIAVDAKTGENLHSCSLVSEFVEDWKACIKLTYSWAAQAMDTEAGTGFSTFSTKIQECDLPCKQDLNPSFEFWFGFLQFSSPRYDHHAKQI